MHVCSAVNSSGGPRLSAFPKLLAWVRANPGDTVFAAGLLLIAVGFAWAWPPLGLIVPGCVLCGLMVFWRLVETIVSLLPPIAGEKQDAQPVDADRETPGGSGPER